MEPSQPGAELVKRGCPSVLRIQARVRVRLAEQTPTPTAPSAALSSFLRICGGIPEPRPAAAEAGANSGVSARRRCGAQQTAKEKENPGPGAGHGGVVIPPPRASTFAGGAVSGSPLFVLSRSAPAVNHVLCGSPPALASAVVFLLLCFPVPEELAQMSWAPPQLQAPTATLKAVTGHPVCHPKVAPRAYLLSRAVHLFTRS